MAVAFVPGKSLAPMPELSYLRMLADGAPKGGVDVWDRSLEEQKRLRALYLAGRGPLAAPARKNAPHVRRYAFDTHTTGENKKYDPSDFHKWLTVGGDGSKWYAKESIRANKYGWRRSAKGERWHYGYFLKEDKVLWRIVQKAIGGLTVDGIPGIRTNLALKKWQKANGLVADGIPGAKTLEKMKAMSGTPNPVVPSRTLRQGDEGQDVQLLAQLLHKFNLKVGTPVSTFGPMMNSAVRSFQTAEKLTVDGIVGPLTYKALVNTPARTITQLPVPNNSSKKSIIIVAGAGNTKAGKLSDKYERRLDVALKLLKANPSWSVVVTGGPSSGRTEAENAKAYLVGSGIGAERILVEDTSGSTHSNFTRGLPIARQAGATGLIVVSDLSHSRRCLAFAYAANRAQGVNLPIVGAEWYRDTTVQDATVSGATQQAKAAWSGMTEAMVKELDAKWGVNRK